MADPEHQHPRTGRAPSPCGSWPRTAPPSATPTSGSTPTTSAIVLRWMVVARRLDRECIALQRQGELTVYPGFEGQEAAQVGSRVRPRPRRLRLPDLPRAGGRARARGRSRPVPPVPPRHLARRPVRPARDPVRPDLHPDRDADRARGRVRARPAARRRRRGDDRVLRRRRDERGRLPRGGEPRRRLAAAARAVLPEQRLGDQRADRASRPRARSGGAPRGTASRASASTATTCWPCTRPRASARARAPWRRGSDADRGDDLPDRRALHRRRRHALPRPTTEVERGAGVRPDRRGSGRGSSRRAHADDGVRRGVRGRRPRRSRCRCARALVAQAAAARRVGSSTGSTPSRPRRSCASARRRSGG